MSGVRPARSEGEKRHCARCGDPYWSTPIFGMHFDYCCTVCANSDRDPETEPNKSYFCCDVCGDPILTERHEIEHVTGTCGLPPVRPDGRVN